MKAIIMGHERGGSYVMDREGDFRFLRGYASRSIGEEIDFTVQSVSAYANIIKMAACIVLSALIGSLSWMWFNESYTAYIDINPSVKLEMNYYNWLKTAQPLNEDGASLLEYTHLNGSLNSALVNLLVAAEANGYLVRNDDYPVVSVSITTRNGKNIDKYKALIEAVIDKNMLHGLVGVYAYEKDFNDKAAALGVSPRKLMLAEQLLAVNQTIPLEELLQMPVKDIIDIEDNLIPQAHITDKDLEYELLQQTDVQDEGAAAGLPQGANDDAVRGGGDEGPRDGEDADVTEAEFNADGTTAAGAANQAGGGQVQINGPQNQYAFAFPGFDAGGGEPAYPVSGIGSIAAGGQSPYAGGGPGNNGGNAGTDNPNAGPGNNSAGGNPANPNAGPGNNSGGGNPANPNAGPGNNSGANGAANGNANGANNGAVNGNANSGANGAGNSGQSQNANATSGANGDVSSQNAGNGSSNSGANSQSLNGDANPGGNNGDNASGEPGSTSGDGDEGVPAVPAPTPGNGNGVPNGPEPTPAGGNGNIVPSVPAPTPGGNGNGVPKDPDPTPGEGGSNGGNPGGDNGRLCATPF